MEAIWNEWNMERSAGNTVAQAMLETQVPLPAGREALRVVHAQGDARNQTAHCAAGRIEAEGVVALQILIEPPDGERPYGLRATANYKQDIPLEGVEEGMRALVKPQLQELRCRLDNGRLMVSGILELAVSVTASSRMRVLSGVSGAQGVQLKRETIDGQRRVALGGANTRLRESFPGAQATAVLLQSAAAEVRGLELTEGGVALSGNLCVSALCADESGQLSQVSRNFLFDELVPVQEEHALYEMGELDATAVLRDLSVTPAGEAGEGLDMEAALEVQLFGSRREPCEAVTDAYALDGGLCCTHERVLRLTQGSVVRQKCSVRESVAVPAEAPDAFRSVYAAARPVVTGVSDADGRMGVDGVLFLSVVFQADAGGVFGFEEEVPFQCVADTPYRPGAIADARALNAQVSGSGRMLDVMVSMEVEVQGQNAEELTLVVDAQPCDPPELPAGLLIYLASEGETLWDVGKRFGLRTEDVLDWNPGIQEPLAEGKQLLLLRGPHPAL